MLAHPIAKCSKTLAANTGVAPLDVVKMKSVLKALGHYKAPEWGVSQYPDAALFAAIAKFQRAQGLKPDGIVKPDGATEAALSRALTPRRATTALQNTAQALQAMGRGGDELLAHITREEAALLHSVTDGATINPQTGLLEFWHDYESEAAGVGDYGENSGPDRDNDRGGDGQDQNTSDNTAGNDTTDNGDTPQNDPNNDGDDFGWGADDQDKSQDRARRASAKEDTLAGGRGFLDTNEEDDEDAQDWDPSLLGESETPSITPNTPAGPDVPGQNNNNNLVGNLVDPKALEALVGPPPTQQPVTHGVQVADATVNLSFWEKLTGKTPEQKAAEIAYEKYVQRFYPDYKHNGNNLGASYNNTFGTKGSWRALGDAIGFEGQIKGGQTLQGVASTRKDALGGAIGATGTFMEMNGRRQKRDFLSPSYNPLTKSEDDNDRW